MDKITILYICGFYNLVLMVFHIFFWSIFKWKKTLAKGTKTNAIATQIMNVQLIYLFLFMAIVCFVYPNQLLNSKMGYVLLLGYAIFWIIRFVQQFVFLKLKGSFVITLTTLFFIGAIIHTLPILL